MKILVLQLARLGDILQAWPSIRALSEKFPKAEIHILVRERFAVAAEAMGDRFVVHKLPTASILEPLLSETDGSPKAAIDRLSDFVDGLGSFDRIYNLSFSPTSSYLTHALSNESSVVKGYTRHPDGYFHVPDDGSAYFYAQVGVDKYNRIHLVDLFSTICEVDLTARHFGRRPLVATARADQIVVHMGASTSAKIWPVVRWREFFKRLRADYSGRIVLIGSSEERRLAETLKEEIECWNLVDRIGATSFAELFDIISTSRLLIGGDSAPVHIAMHTATPVLNLSLGPVRFWETGPYPIGSGVLRSAEPSALKAAAVQRATLHFLNTTAAPDEMIVRMGAEEPFYREFVNPVDRFPWLLIKAIYMREEFPALPDDGVVRLALQRLAEVTQVALMDIQALERDPRNQAVRDLLEQVDHVIVQVVRMVPEIGPLVRWFETERVRLGPMPLSDLFMKTRRIFEDLQTVLSVYVDTSLLGTGDAGESEAALNREGLACLDRLQDMIPHCSMRFRQYETAGAESEFQQILRDLTFLDENGLRDGSTKVADLANEWRSATESFREVAAQLSTAFERKDYVYVADLIEYEIPPCLRKWRNTLVKWRQDVLS